MSLDPPAVLHDGVARRPRVYWLRLGPHAWIAQSARRFAGYVLADVHRTGDHVDAVTLATSELVTNALHATVAYAATMRFAWTYLDTPIHYGVRVDGRYTELLVRDPDPSMPPCPSQSCDLLEESGRGLAILDVIAAAVWSEPGGSHKTVRAIIPVPDVTLTADELTAIKAGRQ